MEYTLKLKGSQEIGTEYTLKLKGSQEIGTSCFICEGVVPIDLVSGGDPQRICKECRKRLKEMLYPTVDMRGEKE